MRKRRLDEAIEAVRSVGTNAIPVLVELTKVEDSALRKWAIGAALRIRYRMYGEGYHHEVAFWGFNTLKATAVTAVPMLVDIVSNPSRRAEVRLAAIRNLGQIGPGAEGAVPALIAALGDGDIGVRIGAIYALGSIHMRAEEAIPALARSLDETQRSVQEVKAVMRTLCDFGDQAGTMASAITRLSSMPQFREEAIECLEYITHSTSRNPGTGSGTTNPPAK